MYSNKFEIKDKDYTKETVSYYKALIPLRYTVWWNVKDQETTANSFCFVRWEDDKPLFSNCMRMARWFDYSEAQKVAHRLGGKWDVVDMWPVMSEEDHLRWEIFCNNSMGGDNE